MPPQSNLFFDLCISGGHLLGGPHLRNLYRDDQFPEGIPLGDRPYSSLKNTLEISGEQNTNFITRVKEVC